MRNKFRFTDTAGAAAQTLSERIPKPTSENNKSEKDEG